MAERTGSEATLRVSDAAEVPLRGYLLRLKVIDGALSLKDLKKGRLRFVAPDGDEREVSIRDLSLMGGRATQKRLEHTGEVDVIVPASEALRDGRPIGLGWTGRLVRG